MSLAWSFPSPHGEPCWPRWALSTTAGWPLDSLDPKQLMRLGPELADRLAGLDARSAPAGEVYIVWRQARPTPCPW